MTHWQLFAFSNRHVEEQYGARDISHSCVRWAPSGPNLAYPLAKAIADTFRWTALYHARMTWVVCISQHLRVQQAKAEDVASLRSQKDGFAPDLHLPKSSCLNYNQKMGP